MSSEMQQIEEPEVKADARIDLAVERTELVWERTHLPRIIFYLNIYLKNIFERLPALYFLDS